MTDSENPVHVGRSPLLVADVIAVLDGRSLQLDPDPDYRAGIQAGADVVRARVESGEPLYGVTTGFGDSCETSVPPEHVAALQHNLLRYHGCGTGPILDDRAARAVLVVRLASLARGYSGVRPELLERLAAMIELGVLPQIPAQGSVGASGDLTPLSYVAAAIIGEREVSFGGEVTGAAEALRRAGLEPMQLAPKEGLALMNGTSVMTALGCIAWDRGRRMARFAAAITAMAADVLRSNRHHFDPRIDELKPHPGQRAASQWIRDDLEWDPKKPDARERLQDRYSIRCAPHVIGVLVDALDMVQRVLDVEINSVNDNPLVDPERGDFVNGGNFYGGHVAFALDGLKTATANVAGLLDRQLALLCSTNTNNGLPANLVAPGGDSAARHGFKAMQISTSALTAEALKLTMPASVFSRSTECHNQDIVSMGLHAARDSLQVLDLTETVGAICALAVCQGVDLRGLDSCHLRAKELHRAVRARVPPVEADRRQDGDIVAVLDLLRRGELPHRKRRMTERLHETIVELEVPFHDCDPLGVVWHGHYYKYAELARTRMLTALDLDGEELLATGHRFYVIESKCRYAYPLRYREKVRVTAWIKETTNRIFVSFEIYNLTAERRAARGHTVLATTDAAGNLLLETPDALVHRILG